VHALFLGWSYSGLLPRGIHGEATGLTCERDRRQRHTYTKRNVVDGCDLMVTHDTRFDTAAASKSRGRAVWIGQDEDEEDDGRE
jgi:hypothetical protein